MLESYPEPDAGRRDEAADAAIAEWIEFLTSVRADPGISRTPPDWAPDHFLQLLPRRPDDGVAATATLSSLEGERDQTRRELERARGILANERFLAKAPPAKVEEEREKERRYAARLADIEARLAELA
jgi:hypothetical protein